LKIYNQRLVQVKNIILSLQPLSANKFLEKF